MKKTMKNSDWLYWPVTLIALAVVGWIFSPELAHLAGWQAIRAIPGAPVGAITTTHGVYAAGVEMAWLIIVYVRSRSELSS